VQHAQGVHLPSMVPTLHVHPKGVVPHTPQAVHHHKVHIVLQGGEPRRGRRSCRGRSRRRAHSSGVCRKGGSRRSRCRRRCLHAVPAPATMARGGGCPATTASPTRTLLLRGGGSGGRSPGSRGQHRCVVWVVAIPQDPGLRGRPLNHQLLLGHGALDTPGKYVASGRGAQVRCQAHQRLLQAVASSLPTADGTWVGPVSTCNEAIPHSATQSQPSPTQPNPAIHPSSPYTHAVKAVSAATTSMLHQRSAGVQRSASALHRDQGPQTRHDVAPPG
jgi:hypothetical protein